MKKIMIAIFITAGVATYAQQDAMYTHYMYNTLAVNPAYAGTRHALTITGLGRYQWAGFEGAPKTYSLTAHSPLLHETLGLGLSLVQDQVGPVDITHLFADIAYELKVSENSNLSFGIKGGINLRSNALTDLQLNEDGDDNFGTNISGDVLPNFGAGFYYSNKRFYVGLSVPKLIENETNADVAGVSVATFNENRHYFAIAGAILDLNSIVKFKPTMLLKLVENAPIEFDVTANFLLIDKFWLGGMYRSRDAIGLLLGYQFTDHVLAGYSFDLSTTKLMSYNSGSHEIMITYDFFYKEKGKIKSPRYF